MNKEMFEKIVIGVASGSIGTVFMWLATTSLSRLNDASALAVAKAIVSDDNSRLLLILHMQDISIFRGPEGPKGAEGKQGPSASICDQKIRFQNQADLNFYLHMHAWAGSNNFVGGHPAGKSDPQGLWQIKC